MLSLRHLLKSRFCLRCRAAYVAHLSPLADVFNTSQTVLSCTSGEIAKAGLFGNIHLTSPSGFKYLVDDASYRCSELLQEAVSPNRTRKMVQILDDMSDSLCRVADLADCIRMLHPEPEFREAATTACRAIGSLVEELNTVPELYAASLRSSTNDRLPADRVMDCIDKRVLDLFIADFELSGVQLKDPIRQSEFVRAATDALFWGSEFVQASHTPVNFCFPNWLTGEQEDIQLTQHLTDEPRAHVREASYRAFYAPLPDQEHRLTQLMRMRHQMARAAGFDRFADRATLHSLATSVENVNVFLEAICSTLAAQAAQTARAHLIPAVYKSDDPASKGRLQPWDIGYALGVGRQTIQIDELCDYFSLGACMEGVSQLSDCLFGLRLQVEPVQPGETWHPTVVKVGVYSTEAHSDNLVGLVYCDLLDRPGKPTQDCHYTIQGGRRLEPDAYQKPIITLQLTISQPTAPDRPPLLSPGQVENLFHEWGHALHSMLARTRYQHVTGTRCSTDLAEVPSTVFERFALDPRVTKEYARHWRSGAAPGTQELEALRRLAVGGHLGSSVEVIQQATYARLDQVLHSGPPETTLLPHTRPNSLPPSCNLLSQIQLESGLSDWFTCAPNDLLAWPHRFTHLVGYGGRYYAYLMARAGAQLIWESCFARDPWSSSKGKLYADHLLRLGGEFPPARMISNVLMRCGGQGSDESLAESCLLSPEQLARGLVAQVEENEAAASALLVKLGSPGMHRTRVNYRDC